VIPVGVFVLTLLCAATYSDFQFELGLDNPARFSSLVDWELVSHRTCRVGQSMKDVRPIYTHSHHSHSSLSLQVLDSVALPVHNAYIVTL
jgi:hypothetical protein